MSINPTDPSGRRDQHRPQPDEFCERCGVHQSLHSDPDDPSEADCDTASQKADLIERFPL